SAYRLRANRPLGKPRGTNGGLGHTWIDRRGREHLPPDTGLLPVSGAWAARGQGGERANSCLRARGDGDAAYSPASVTLARLLTLRWPSGRDGRFGSGARQSNRRERAGGRHRRRAGRRQEPPLLRVSRTLSGTGPCDLRGAWRSAREGASAATN